MAANMNEQYVSKVLTGKINPTLDNLVKICNSSNINFYEIVLDAEALEQVQSFTALKGGVPGSDAKRQEIAALLITSFTRRRLREENDK